MKERLLEAKSGIVMNTFFIGLAALAGILWTVQKTRELLGVDDGRVDPDKFRR